MKKRRGKKLATVGESPAVLLFESKEPVTSYRIVRQEVPVEIKSLRVLTGRTQEYLPAVLSAIEEGFECPLEVLNLLKMMQTVVNDTLVKVQILAIREARKYQPEELKSYFGLEWGKSATSWNYADDNEYQLHEKALKARTQLLKKATKNGKAWVNEETGEIIYPVSIKTPSKAYLKTSSKK